MENPNHGLKRELKLRDLVLMQVVLIFSLVWIGFTAKQGPTQLALWLIAIVLFYIPLAAVVMKLSRAMPVEGGSYQWVKQGLSPFAGYMAGWSLTVYAISAFAPTGSMLANGFAWVAGPRGAWMGASKPFALILTLGFCLLAYLVNVRGLHLAKWLSGVSSVLWFMTSLVLLYLLMKAWISAAPLAHASFSFAFPSFSVLTVIVLAKMSIGALGGFDTSAVFAEECRKPENDVARSVSIAAPLIAFMYILGTASLLAYTKPSDIDLAAPVQQLMHAGFGSGGWATALTWVAVGTFTIAVISSLVVFLGMVARLPMVAGWDGLLPGWWSELHPVYRTPSKAIGAVTVSIMLIGVLSLWGAGNQEAVQATAAVGVASLCLMYMLLFGVVLFGFRSRADRPGLGLRLGALTAFLVALVSFVFQIVPLGEVASPAIFAIKVIVSICTTSGVGAYLYWRGAQRSRLVTLRSVTTS
jgi:glutamate:GABA antiporter